MSHLSALHLRVASIEAATEFYVRHCGMTARSTDRGVRVGYDGPDADLLLIERREQIPPGPNERYWKIGITLPNVDIAAAQLRTAGFDVSEPGQFRDIGYMCHLGDPNGLAIELLQHDFRDNRPDTAGDPGLPLGGGGRVGQITLRTNDIGEELVFYEGLGMSVLSMMPVPALKFDLHFLAFTQETPPDTNLDAIANREWLWKRPYTTLEFKHLAGKVVLDSPVLAAIEVAGAEPGLADPFDTPVVPG